jgi:hypothetical protein
MKEASEGLCTGSSRWRRVKATALRVKRPPAPLTINRGNPEQNLNYDLRSQENVAVDLPSEDRAQRKLCLALAGQLVTAAKDRTSNTFLASYPEPSFLYYSSRSPELIYEPSIIQKTLRAACHVYFG